MNVDDEPSLIAEAKAGSEAALGQLLERHRPRLKLGVALRQNPLARARFDASDVMQEAFIEAARRFAGDYDESVPFFVWLRFLVQQQLFALTRRHLDAEKRDARREINIDQDVSHVSQIMATHFVSNLTSPSEELQKRETLQKVEALIEQMDPQDRELLLLRHHEQLSNIEAAAVMNMNPSTASSRYIRALQWIREQMDQIG